ncbi:nitrate ABC transporter ATP-binding protein [Candidatus Roizmanbacteria bacterium CG_4_9_14_3_um_filter_33_18]|uniref:Nitrate ABC transporter ATP-binding protein n=5 Tax=Candidatus Roizmaniibacteriota TaxID=1752723 RepID=A0A2H0KND2_9BACT|nr:MAG: nitrate ABC transporter ATP-binding protein [Candidatus Roizmanbacteria bacterium CG11_big_fil_rev_8_21_14_0_20_37_16]PIU36548.1 MAG: nitrate ABC transporter ATP-binding protein [Candidatus Roizmanbacteria bacterium CG07_land_8_20_14_0_80_34_15]PIU74665.1 MAG: nitrate ABC transporter ATP-binding protein [Candidatus Roizmanbacteria bacterium CG06_land_8_20_14_3_00_34_14]PJA55123.1 MAG: nitrate ABC transporter ATP-binding protein [Candidatus Roizmanbacteria bacterium CG_4_9_14_3_um_filter_
MKKGPKLIIKNLSLSFEESIIRKISLDVNEGEIVSIIGPSGCGKSTLFNVISGILKQDDGVIKIDGLEEKQRQGKFGYMFQEPLLFPWLKVLDNIMLGFEIKGLEKNQVKIEALDLLKKFNLFEYSNFYPNNLSGGMKQKVALLRTIAFNSNILLLDEPFGSLDAITRSSLHLYLLEIWKKLKLSIIFTTHDIREAIFLSDRVYVLSKKPANVVDCIKINLPRPRKIADLTSPKFVEMEKKLMSLL